MEMVITPGGQLRCLYDESLDFSQLGQVTIRRGSFVEPDPLGQWHADLAPVAGPLLGPFASRSRALAAETAWLTAHWLSQAST